jgi:hypothetical protein
MQSPISNEWGIIKARMASFEIRREPGQVTIELSSPIGRGTALLYFLGLALLAAEMYVTFPYRAGVVRTIPDAGAGGHGGILDWVIWIAVGLGCLLMLAALVASQRRRTLIRREQIRFTRDAVICRREFLVGRPRTERYEMNAIQRPYYEPHKGITFGYTGRTARIGVGMARFELSDAIAAVLREFPEMASILAHCTDAPPEKSSLPSIIAK